MSIASEFYPVAAEESFSITQAENFIVKVKNSVAVEESFSEKIVKFSVDFALKVGTGYTFRNYHYAMVVVKFIFDKGTEIECLDSDCFVSLMNRAYFFRIYLELPVKSMANSTTV